MAEGLVDGEDLGTIIEAHKRSTITSYGTRTNSNLRGNLPVNMSKETSLDKAEGGKDSNSKTLNKSKVNKSTRMEWMVT